MENNLDHVNEHTRTAIRAYQNLFNKNIDEIDGQNLINLGHTIYFFNNKNKSDFIENIPSITHFLCHENDSAKLNGIKFISEICVSSERIQKEIASQNGIEILFDIIQNSLNCSNLLLTWSCYALSIVINDNIDNIIRFRNLYEENRSVLHDAIQHLAWSNGWKRNYASILGRLIGIDDLSNENNSAE